MTNEEAITILKKYMFINKDDDIYTKAVLKAIEALKNEQPHGKWVEHLDYVGDTYYTCSHCGEDWLTIEGKPTDNLMNYCPFCGAEMEADNEDDQDAGNA